MTDKRPPVAADAREGLAHGAFDYLTKPCLLDDLIQRIREACRNGSRSSGE
ncbi:MAG: hypothetical protein ABFD98_03855 [Syntrophobacteraceae bacterium]|nr:hypothetical protein [Desulfobacteraceae bacterium]